MIEYTFIEMKDHEGNLLQGLIDKEGNKELAIVNSKTVNTIDMMSLTLSDLAILEDFVVSLRVKKQTKQQQEMMNNETAKQS